MVQGRGERRGRSEEEGRIGREKGGPQGQDGGKRGQGNTLKLRKGEERGRDRARVRPRGPRSGSRRGFTRPFSFIAALVGRVIAPILWMRKMRFKTLSDLLTGTTSKTGAGI